MELYLAGTEAHLGCWQLFWWSEKVGRAAPIAALTPPHPGSLSMSCKHLLPSLPWDVFFLQFSQTNCPAFLSGCLSPSLLTRRTAFPARDLLWRFHSLSPLACLAWLSPDLAEHSLPDSFPHTPWLPLSFPPGAALFPWGPFTWWLKNEFP